MLCTSPACFSTFFDLAAMSSWVYLFIKIQGRCTALLFLVNPRIPHQNNGTVFPMANFRLKRMHIIMFNPLYSSTNQQLFKKKLCSESSRYENYRLFLLWMEAIMFLTQNWHFSHWTKTNGIQRKALVSPWRMANGTFWDEAMSNSKKIKPVTLAIVELHESEGSRQLVS